MAKGRAKAEIYVAEDAPVPQRVNLSDILQHPEFQIRRDVEPDPATVRRYATAYKAGEELPPVTLVRHNGALVLADGWHRVAALRSIDQHQVSAVVLPAARLEEVRWIGAEKNLTHGRPLKASEFAEVFKAYIRARRHRDGKRFKSYREIAAELHNVKSHNTIRNWMRRYFPRIAGAMGGDDDFKGKGGLDDRSHDFEDSLYRDAAEALQYITKAVEALSSETRRGDLVLALELALARLKAKPYDLPMF